MRHARQLPLRVRRRLELLIPPIAEGVPPEERWDYVTNREGWTAKQLMFQRSFEIFDDLPKAVRHALHEAVVTWEPAPIAATLLPELEGKRARDRRTAIKRWVERLNWAEAQDCGELNWQYRLRYGTPLPHVAAQASILRYYSADDRREARGLPRRGVPQRPVRHRSPNHRRFVATCRCIVCGADPPSDPHHLKYLQPRAKGLKAGDQWTIPMCRVHHDQVEAAGDEEAWWAKMGIDPKPLAIELWGMTTWKRRHPTGASNARGSTT